MEFFDVTGYLSQLTAHPLAIAGAIVLATFILEDGATIGAALLAVDGVISPYLAVSALYVGISLGDMGLYGLGRLAAINTRIRAWVGRHKLRAGRRWLNRRLPVALFGARFMPGMRLPTYVTSGFLRIRFSLFALYAIAAALLWTTVFFSLVFFFGSMAAQAIGDWVWVVGLMFVLILIASSFLSIRRSVS